MNLWSSRDRSLPRRALVWAGATWGLLGAASLGACDTVKADLCTAVHTRVLEELRTSDGAARSVLDPWACERHARRLHELAEELHTLQIHDASLQEAVDAYRVEVEHLSEAYGRLAVAYRNSPELALEEAQRVHSSLRRGVLDQAASLNLPRARVQSACGSL